MATISLTNRNLRIMFRFEIWPTPRFDDNKAGRQQTIPMIAFCNIYIPYVQMEAVLLFALASADS